MVWKCKGLDCEAELDRPKGGSVQKNLEGTGWGWFVSHSTAGMGGVTVFGYCPPCHNDIKRAAAEFYLACGFDHNVTAGFILSKDERAEVKKTWEEQKRA